MFAGALVFTGVVTMLAPPAEAGSLPPPTVSITGPARGAVVGAVGTVVRGTVTPNGCLPGAPGQDTFTLNLTLRPSAGQPPRSLIGHATGPAACGPSGHPVPATFSVGLPNLDSSGAWTVVVKASQRGPVSSSSSRPATTAVSVPPAAPRQVAAHVLGGGPGRPAVVVTWAPGPEPDIAGYNVLRRSGGAWRVVGTTAATSYRDPGVTGGSRYAYQVVATRAGVGGATLSSPRSAPVSIAVPAARGSAGGTPAPALGGPPPSVPDPAPPLSPPTSQGVTGAPSQGGYQRSLPYPTLAAAPTAGTRPATSRRGEAGTVGLVALGMLLLAVAAHLRRLYAAVTPRGAHVESGDPGGAGPARPAASSPRGARVRRHR